MRLTVIWQIGVARVDWMFSFALAAYNLVRMRNLDPHQYEASDKQRPARSATVRSCVTEGLGPT